MSAPATPSADLADARMLYERREWIALADRLRPLGEAALLAEPELAFLYADTCRRLGDTATALRLAVAAEPLAARTGDRRLVVNVINLVGITLFEMGRLEEAQRRFEQLLERSTDWEDVDFAARAANGLGNVAHLRGRRDLSLSYYERAIAGYTRTGNRRGLAQTHYNQGLAFRDLGFDDDADARYQRAMELAQATGSEEVVALAEVERAVLRVRQGDGRLAASMAARAGERFQKLGDPTGYAGAVRVMASAARVRGNDDEAAARLDEALAVSRQHEDPLLRAEVQRDRGLLLRDRGRDAEARAALLEAAENYERLEAAEESAAIRTILAGI
ncbi:MAG TPA: tetratricopeptide repeat protein [Longimicrobium sp.]